MVIAKIDDLAAIRGKRLVVEFHQADKDGSGGVSDIENRCACNFVDESIPQRVEVQVCVLWTLKAPRSAVEVRCEP